MKVGAVVLAAGGSSRLGQPKQLLHHEGRTLVRRTTETALAAGLSPVVVVLGAHREAVAAELAGLPVHPVHNPDWAAGMGGSLRVGLRALPPESVDAALVVLCDQLRVDAPHLSALVDTFSRTQSPIVASGYAGARGVPVLFSRTLFAELEALAPEEGARRVIAREPSRVVEVALAGGAEDVDTAADLARLTGVPRG
ncbi:nucleotidyltransferase family protein [Stigmatella aurantiaca]|uniref:4-diphosphocytidyl-2C-methyl-D-erythritol synthase n=1 Tax=Stigmatella aurantiaca (strain DW4/3-1) TaxID=378806 RepID=E3FUS2_STIAD|nr:nucleotidyltransferase family protein [Stigmatella aurantiaca]ADO75955.1 4-diphosphocytidyl-2C-methyl-D-erythritol synthase [Stigmatella aurantiaca DW4/3-1]